MFSNFVIFAGLLVSVTISASTNQKCATEEFFKTFECIGKLAEFVASVEKFDLTKEIDRANFTEDCKKASDCFGNVSCLHSDVLKKFLQTYCSYSTFLETDFKECKTKLDAREEKQCEKSFKSFFDNSVAEDVKCNQLDSSLMCINKEVTTVCGANDAKNIAKYLEDMSESLFCKEVKEKALANKKE